MHGPAFAGTQRARRTSAGNLRTRTLKNWLPRHGTTGRRTHRRSSRRTTGTCGWSDGRDRTRRGFIYRTRPSLRNNHPRSRRLRSYRRSRTRGDWSRRSCSHWCRWRGSCGRRKYGRRRRGRTRRRWRNGQRRCRNYMCRRPLHRKHKLRRRRRRNGRDDRRHRSCWRRYSRRCGPGCWNGWNGSNRFGRNRWWRCRARRRCDCFFLLRNCFEHISGAGNVRQINFGLDFFFAAKWTRGFGSRRLRFGRAANVGPHFYRFVLLDRTGVRLFLRHPDEHQRVENGFALNFQLSGEIVDSNLAHPAFLRFSCCA